MPDIHTSELSLRIRLKRVPAPGEFDEYDLGHFREGHVYVMPARLASLLILAGCAEFVDNDQARADTASFNRPRLPKSQ